MATVAAQQPGPFDVLVYDAEGVPVLAAEVKARASLSTDALRWLRDQAPAMGISLGLVVDRSMLRLFDLAAKDAPLLMELPTRQLLESYAHDLEADRVSEQYLVLLTNTWLRNVMQPLANLPPPGIERLRELGITERLRDGRAVFEWRYSF